MRGARNLALAPALAFAVAGCTGAKPASEPTGATRVRVGLSLDTLKEERWQRDRDFFVERIKELGGDVDVQAANSNDQLQNSQAENIRKYLGAVEGMVNRANAVSSGLFEI